MPGAPSRARVTPGGRAWSVDAFDHVRRMCRIARLGWAARVAHPSSSAAFLPNLPTGDAACHTVAAYRTPSYRSIPGAWAWTWPPFAWMSRPAARPWRARYAAVRSHTEQLAAALTAEDQCVQSMPDASPAKWHRAHTTWFFEQFVLARVRAGLPGVRSGVRLPVQLLLRGGRRAASAADARPADPAAGRACGGVSRACRCRDGAADAGHARTTPAALVELGLQHEQQHQELLLTDMLHAFAQNPLAPAVLPDWREPAGAAAPTRLRRLRRRRRADRLAGRRVLLRQRDPGA